MLVLVAQNPLIGRSNGIDMNQRRRVAPDSTRSAEQALAIRRGSVPLDDDPAYHDNDRRPRRYRFRNRRRICSVTFLAVAFVLAVLVSLTSPNYRSGLRSHHQRQSSEKDVILRALQHSLGRPAKGDLLLSSKHDAFSLSEAASTSLYIEYRAARGLGHRLTRSAAAYHCEYEKVRENDEVKC